MNKDKEDCFSTRQECINAWNALDAKEKEPIVLVPGRRSKNPSNRSRQKIQIQHAKTKIDQITKTSRVFKNSFLVGMTLLSLGILLYQGSICISK